MERKWTELTPNEKLEERFKLWLSPKTVFADPQAEHLYKQRVKRLIDVIQLRVPDRVPVSFAPGFFVARYAGITAETAMYDPEKLIQALRKFAQDFDVDTLGGGGVPARPLEILDYKLYKWPGHGTPPNTGYQYVEAEYMKADEYDALIRDPSDFWLRTYLPRVFGALEPLKKLSSLTDIIELPMMSPYLVSLGAPDVQAAFQSLLEAGREAMKWVEAFRPFNREVAVAGFPRTAGGFCKAPFDTLGDTLRGTHGIISDMYRQPDKVLEAMERILAIEIKRGVASATASGVPIVTIPLHKGADGFMSARQFETFYWPTLRKLILGLIEEGVVSSLFAEGSYNTRLEVIKDLPGGKVIWYFDRTDMSRAKEVLGSCACIEGNVPTSLMCSGTPSQVKAYCKALIETAGKNGGFILAPGAGTDEAKPENVHALLDAAHEYGKYQ
ncbi:MAG: uroporphyrinogen decarboxylase [Chloroflexi bacterium]|nr:uroporphyrinogen decarboxylase [Chloroflexota bacterium]